MNLNKQAVLKQNILTFASALVRYAKKDKEFADYFTALILQNIPKDHYSPAAPFRAAPFLVPEDLDSAKTKADWLISELVYFPSHNTDPVAQALLNWADDREVPKDVVLGIVGLAIIGPTLGLIKKKKKKKSQMRVIVNETLAEQTKAAALTELTHNASISLLGNELALVHGDSNRLEPEMAEWLFTDQQTLLYAADFEHIQDILHVMEKEHLPHSVIKSGEYVKAVAVSPSVNDLLSFGDLLE